MDTGLGVMGTLLTAGDGMNGVRAMLLLPLLVAAVAPLGCIMVAAVAEAADDSGCIIQREKIRRSRAARSNASMPERRVRETVS